MTIDCEVLPSLTSREDPTPPFPKKLVLAADFSEVRGGSRPCELVRILLSDVEIVVLKRTSESAGEDSQASSTSSSSSSPLVRRHRLSDVQISQHDSMPNAILVEVPGTVLRYVYQLRNGGCIRDWTTAIMRCRSRASPRRGSSSSVANGDSDHSRFPPLSLPMAAKATHSMMGVRSAPVTPLAQRRRQLALENGGPQPQPRPHAGVGSYLPPLTPPAGLTSKGETSSAGDSDHHWEKPVDPRSPLSLGSGRFRYNLPSLVRAGSERVAGISRRNGVKAGHYQSYRREKLQNGRALSFSIQTPSGADPSEDNLEEKFRTLVSSLPAPGRNDDLTEAFFGSPLRHVQIRRGRHMCSPRLNRSHSLAPPTPTSPSPSPLSTIVRISSSHDGTRNASTLPRSKKLGRKKSDYLVDRVDDAVLSVPASPSPSRPAKSPKILKMFHRRWQSSSGIKLNFVNEPGEQGQHSTIPLPRDDGSRAVPRRLCQHPPREVAEELLAMDSESLQRIAPSEIENGAWMDREAKHELAPNVLAMVASFNRLALLVPTEILDEKSHQARAKVISVFIQLASKCHSLHNFNSLKAVLAGLQCTPIYRLTKTWKEVPSKRRKKFQRLSRLMSEEDNWQLYRRELDLLAAAGTPFIPFLGNFLTQVVQTQSFEKMRRERGPPRTRATSLGQTVSNDAQKREWRSSTISISAPASPVGSDDEDDPSKDVYSPLLSPSASSGGKHQQQDLENFLEFKSLPQSIMLGERRTGSASSDSSVSSKASTKSDPKGLGDFPPGDFPCVEPVHSTPVKPHNGAIVSDIATPGFSLDDSLCVDLFDDIDLGAVSNRRAPVSTAILSLQPPTRPEGTLILPHSTSLTDLCPPSCEQCSTSLVRTSSHNSLSGSPRQVEIVDFHTSTRSHSHESGLDSGELRSDILAELSKFSTSIHSVYSGASSMEDESSLISNGDMDFSCDSESLSSFTHEALLATSLPAYKFCTTMDEDLPVEEDSTASKSLTNFDHDGDRCNSVEVAGDPPPRLGDLKRSRSLGENNARRVIRRKKCSVHILPDMPQATAATPPELLAHFQQACREMKVEGRSHLRGILTSSAHNSENENYKLSMEREQQS